MPINDELSTLMTIKIEREDSEADPDPDQVEGADTQRLSQRE